MMFICLYYQFILISDQIAMGPFDCSHNPYDGRGRMKQTSLARKASSKGVSMNKLRCSLATIALAVALLSGLSLQGIGSMANAASSHHASSASSTFVVGKSTRSVAFRPYPYCPGATTNDC